MTKRILIACLLLGLPWTAVSQEDQYLVPMRFAIIGDGVDQLPLELDYDLSSQKSLRIGDVIISSETVQFWLGNLGDYSSSLSPFLTEDEKAENVLLFRWPSNLLREGTIEAIGYSGRTLWSMDFSSDQLVRWQNRLNEIRDRMAEKIGNAATEREKFFKTTLGESQFLRNHEKFVAGRESFRFCISRLNDEGQSRICSPYMSFVKRKKKWVLERNPEPERPARVIAYQKKAPLKIRAKVNTKVPLQFLAELSQGFIYEFVSRPPQIDIMELVQETDTTAKVVGFGEVPSCEHRILNPLNQSLLVRVLKWEQTIGDLRRFWETSMPLDDPALYFSGPGGGLFRQGFVIRRLPPENLRPYLYRRTPDSTYVNGPWLHAMRAENTVVSSEERRTTGGEDSLYFDWSFQARKRGGLNRSHVIVSDGKQKYKAFYEMYKGYPREISARLGEVLGSGNNFLINGEGSFNYWFEDIFGWTNYWVSRQRWGVSLKYFQSLTPLKVSDVSEPITNMTADLKYRLTPGLWNRDETWGLILAYNDLKYDVFQAKELGAGAFWARSMPKLFDDMFNILPLFQFPKWVDMEFIYYPLPLNQGVTLTLVPGRRAYGNWALNFHGKVLWTQSFFGEAGFGIRSISMTQETPQLAPDILRLDLNFIAFYTTMGIGYQF